MGVGCRCGWPLDSCNPKFAKGKPCGKKRHERETQQRIADGEIERQQRGNKGKRGQ